MSQPPRLGIDDSVRFLPTRREIDQWLNSLLSAHGVYPTSSEHSIETSPLVWARTTMPACMSHHHIEPDGTRRASSSPSSQNDADNDQAATVKSLATNSARDAIRIRRERVAQNEGAIASLRARLGRHAPLPVPPPAPAVLAFPANSNRAVYQELGARVKWTEQELHSLRAKVEVLRRRKRALLQQRMKNG